MAKKKTKRKQPSKTTKLTPRKASLILKEGEIGGKPLTKKQRGFFGAVASKKK